jgi:hypothetical protein
LHAIDGLLYDALAKFQPEELAHVEEVERTQGDGFAITPSMPLDRTSRRCLDIVLGRGGLG